MAKKKGYKKGRATARSSYDTYKDWYMKNAKTNAMDSDMYTQSEYEEMYSKYKKDIDKGIITYKGNIAREIAADQKQYTRKQASALAKGFKKHWSDIVSDTEQKEWETYNPISGEFETEKLTNKELLQRFGYIGEDGTLKNKKLFKVGDVKMTSFGIPGLQEMIGLREIIEFLFPDKEDRDDFYSPEEESIG